MTLRKPVVIIDGKHKQLPAGDTLDNGNSVFTRANWREWVYNGVYSGRGNRGHFNREGIGFSLSLADEIYGIQGQYPAFRRHDFSFSSSGTSAGIYLPIAANVGLAFTSGNTATGSGTLSLIPVVYSKLADGTTYLYNELSEIYTTTRVTTGAVLSSGTDRYTLSLKMQVAGINQIDMNYSDNVNGGKWRLSYVNAANTVVHLDTGITPVVNTGYTPTIIMSWNSGTSQFDIEFTLGAYNVTLTDLRINTQLTSNVSAGSIAFLYSITKSIGTALSATFMTSFFTAISLK